VVLSHNFNSKYGLWVQMKPNADLWLLSNNHVSLLSSRIHENNLTYEHTVPLLAPVDRKSRDNAVATATDWLWAARPRGRSSSPNRGQIFLLSTSSELVLGCTQSPIQWVPEALSQGVKQARREGNDSLLTSADVKNIYIYRYIHLLHQ
jgi:hypothetical protein